MREKWARIIALITGLLVILLAAVFAQLQNPDEHFDQPQIKQPTTAVKPERPPSYDARQIETGMAIYKKQTCARCHSIAGEGNPRIPLDSVGKRLNAEELRNWITGEDSIHGKLSDYAFRVKQAYKKLPEENLDALIAYLQSLQQ